MKRTKYYRYFSLNIGAGLTDSQDWGRGGSLTRSDQIIGSRNIPQIKHAT